MKNRANETALVIGSALRYKELYRYRGRKSGRERERRERGEREEGGECACLSHDATFLIKPYRDVSFSRKRSPCNGHLSRIVNVTGVDCVTYV